MIMHTVCKLLISESLRGHEKKLAKTDQDWIQGNISSIKERVINRWNSLPAKVVNSESVNSFKNATVAKTWTKLISCQSTNL